jgi:hypothetical protein
MTGSLDELTNGKMWRKLLRFRAPISLTRQPSPAKLSRRAEGPPQIPAAAELPDFRRRRAKIVTLEAATLRGIRGACGPPETLGRN